MGEYDMPTDVQFKYDLRKRLIAINEKLELIEDNNIDKLKRVLEEEKKAIVESLQD